MPPMACPPDDDGRVAKRLRLTERVTCTLHAKDLAQLLDPFLGAFSATTSVGLCLEGFRLTCTKIADSTTHALRTVLVAHGGGPGSAAKCRVSARRLRECLAGLHEDVRVCLDLSSKQCVALDVLLPYGPSCLHMVVEQRRHVEDDGDFLMRLKETSPIVVPVELFVGFVRAADGLEALYCSFAVKGGVLTGVCSNEKRRKHSRIMDAFCDLELCYSLVDPLETGGIEGVDGIPVSLLADVLLALDPPTSRLHLGFHEWGLLLRSSGKQPGSSAEAVVLNQPVVCDEP